MAKSLGDHGELFGFDCVVELVIAFVFIASEVLELQTEFALRSQGCVEDWIAVISYDRNV